MNEEIMTNEMNEEVDETMNEVEAYEPEVLPEVMENQESSGLLGKVLMIGIGVGAGILLNKNAPKIKAWNEKRKAKKLEKAINQMEDEGYVILKPNSQMDDDPDDIDAEDEVEGEILDETEDDE